MTKLEQAVKNIHAADNTDNDNDSEKGGIHPLSRLLVTFCYVLVVVSFHKYDLTGLAGMVLYILIQCIWYEISIAGMMRYIFPVLLLTGMIGIANPFFDRTAFFSVGNVAVTGGLLSMAVLMIKGMLCVMASYILVIRTGIRQICYSLRLLRVPEELVTVLLLMHRYLMVLIKETERMQQAYKLRAPGKRGLPIKTWGSFVGLLLLRSIDRAGEIYESMQLRGYHGVIQGAGRRYDMAASFTCTAAWGIAILALRFIPVFQVTGMLLRGLLR